MQKQERVRGEVYEELRMLKALGESCVLQFRGDNGGTASLRTKITDVFEDEDGQYLLCENGLTLRLHRLLAINGKELEAFC